ncbi:hypothetical protein Poly41_24240 [Novipirellula artificiosorum]|uniref:Uncharacterized protein n=1 Tax=Novipirellula artificiosorum TaxID=2528016 RepID=A0A5C6DXL4_9BACT|nr:hypothetical protein Poly41_24240 [Novipirellula artificiosorum]
MSQLLVFAMNIADDMNRALGQGADGREPRNFRHRRIDIRKTFGEQTENGKRFLGWIWHKIVFVIFAV